MPFTNLESGDDAAPLDEINVIPLIDVMLVLLVIFIVTAPLLTHAVRVDLPLADSAPAADRAGDVHLAIDAAGGVHWNGQPVDGAALGRHLAAAAAQHPRPELRIRADRATPYERLAQLMSEAARHGLTRIGFVTDPPGRE